MTHHPDQQADIAGHGPVAVDGLLDLAVDVAHEAGTLLRSYAGRADLDVGTKTTATDPVSAADHASERLIVQRVLAARPDDGLLGEERAGDRHGTSGLRWVVDPLDGTVNYLYGIPQWAVSIAVEDGDGPLVGVVHDPNRDETFAAHRGGGSTLNGSTLRISPPERVAAALIATGYSYDAAARLAHAIMLTDLIGQVRDLRRCGSAALDLSWTAAGRWDGYAEFGLHRWDWSAGSLIVAEAGGTVMRWRHDLGGVSLDGVTAGSALVHDHLADWLRRNGAALLPWPGPQD
ncbi:MAG TPA: inositol monophosphatase family protein [Euzebyales bacterium]|nr:inositol monophosphatase family protein [Euzebyales bacterium]